MPYTLSSAAQGDLERIWDHTVRHWGEAQAETCTRRIQAACEALSNDRLVGRSADDIRARNRKATVGSHMLYYRMQPDVVEIVRIPHRSTDTERHL